ncbi:hypothetical protein E4U55_006874 [Claviceps digitariae]|nr:hypothetical protein E4U55_006874 [Claviceps digitariae]
MAALRRFAPLTWSAHTRRHFAQRTFHSYEHISQSQSMNAAEDAILSAAYRHVPKHGFSNQSLNLGARDAGYLDISPTRQRLGLASKCQTILKTKEKSPHDVCVESKIADIMWARLLANEDIIHKWQEALAIMAQPSYIPVTMRELALLSDDIWYLAGDKSVDFSWYTKRASLSMVYSTTELFMTNDKSPGFFDTHSFMLRRLDETKTLRGLVDSISTWTSFTMKSSVNLLRSRGNKVNGDQIRLLEATF